MKEKQIVRYYAAARNAKGEIEQLVVTCDPSSHKTITHQEFTGRIYQDDEEAAKDLERLNGKEG